MIDSARVLKLLDQLRNMSAADMKTVEKFGKVKGYSRDYAELKDSMRSLVVQARNVHDVDLEAEFAAIRPIQFTGLVPNEAFNAERRQLIALGEDLAGRLARAGSPGARGIGAAVAETPVGAAPAPGERRRIYVSETVETPATSDLKRCLATADCDVVPARGEAAGDPAYSPAAAIDQIASCHGAMICLMEPQAAPDAPPAAVAALRERVARLTLLELGMALGRCPGRTFLVVQASMLPEVPAPLHDLISFRTQGDQPTFEEGQRMVQIFKKPQWNSKS